MNRFLLLAATAAAFSSSAVLAGVVTDANPDGWAPANVRANGSVAITSTYQPAGQNGSLEFATNTIVSGQDKADYTKAWGDVSGRTLGNLASLEYSSYRDGSTTGVVAHLAPAFRLIYATASGDTGYLIWEPIYNGNSSVATDVWNDVDILGGNFWMRTFAPGKTIEQFGVTLSGWMDGASFAGSDLLDYNTKIVGIEVGVGSGWGGSFHGAVDNIGLSFQNISSRAVGNDLITANFEVANVPEPAAWTLLIAGFGLVGTALRRHRTTVAA